MNWTPENIRALLDSRQETREASAARLYVSRGTLQAWLSGLRQPSRRNQRKLDRLKLEQESKR